jgi:hypothetical protein
MQELYGKYEEEKMPLEPKMANLYYQESLDNIPEVVQLQGGYTMHIVDIDKSIVSGGIRTMCGRGTSWSWFLPTHLTAQEVYEKCPYQICRRCRDRHVI